MQRFTARHAATGTVNRDNEGAHFRITAGRADRRGQFAIFSDDAGHGQPSHMRSPAGQARRVQTGQDGDHADGDGEGPPNNQPAFKPAAVQQKIDVRKH